MPEIIPASEAEIGKKREVLLKYLNQKPIKKNRDSVLENSAEEKKEEEKRAIKKSAVILPTQNIAKPAVVETVISETKEVETATAEIAVKENPAVSKEKVSLVLDLITRKDKVSKPDQRDESLPEVKNSNKSEKKAILKIDTVAIEEVREKNKLPEPIITVSKERRNIFLDFISRKSKKDQPSAGNDQKIKKEEKIPSKQSLIPVATIAVKKTRKKATLPVIAVSEKKTTEISLSPGSKFFTRLKSNFSAIKINFASIKSLAIHCAKAISVFIVGLYFLLCLVFYTFTPDNLFFRAVNEYLPVPAMITPYGSVDFYQYKQVGDYLILNGLFGESVNLWALKRQILERLAEKYGLNKELSYDLLYKSLQWRVASDEELNYYPSRQLRFLKNGQLVGDINTLAGTLHMQVRSEYLSRPVIIEKFGTQALSVPVGGISRIIMADDGLYIISPYDNAGEMIGMYYIFIKTNTLEEIIKSELGRAWVLSLIN